MAQPHPAPALPRAPAWDITFTRLAQTMRPQVEAFALDLARRFRTLDLVVEKEGRQTPRGLSTFLAIVGERGLICIVDLTLVDGMATCQGPCAALDIRLLDACGDVVAEGLAHGIPVRNARENLAAQALMSDKLGRAATAIYVATLGHFELLPPVARYG